MLNFLCHISMVEPKLKKITCSRFWPVIPLKNTPKNIWTSNKNNNKKSNSFSKVSPMKCSKNLKPLDGNKNTNRFLEHLNNFWFSVVKCSHHVFCKTKIFIHCQVGTGMIFNLNALSLIFFFGKMKNFFYFFFWSRLFDSQALAIGSVLHYYQITKLFFHENLNDDERLPNFFVTI